MKYKHIRVFEAFDMNMDNNQFSESLVTIPLILKYKIKGPKENIKKANDMAYTINQKMAKTYQKGSIV